MTYIQAFDKIKEKLDGKAKISQEYDSFAVQVTMTNKDSHGIFYLKYSDGFLDIQPYDYFDNDAAVSLSYQTFLKLTDGRLSLDDAVSKGLAEIYGSRSAAAAICGIVPQDKPQTEKSAPKSAAAKTETKTKAKTEAKEAKTEDLPKNVKAVKAAKTSSRTKKTAGVKTSASDSAKAASAKDKAIKAEPKKTAAAEAKPAKADAKSKK